MNMVQLRQVNSIFSLRIYISTYLKLAVAGAWRGLPVTLHFPFQPGGLLTEDPYGFVFES